MTTPLRFVRFEPFVVPKRSLTGDSTERVDTRVLQVIYRVERDDLPLFVGQQVDVFIDAQPEKRAYPMSPRAPASCSCRPSPAPSAQVQPPGSPSRSPGTKPCRRRQRTPSPSPAGGRSSRTPHSTASSRRPSKATWTSSSPPRGFAKPERPAESPRAPDCRKWLWEQPTPAPSAAKPCLPSSRRPASTPLRPKGTERLRSGIRRELGARRLRRCEARQGGRAGRRPCGPEGRREALVTLLADVGRNYLELRGTQQQIRILEETLASQQDTLDIAKARFDAGLGTELDVARAEGLLRSNEAERPVLERQARQAIYRISVLLGKHPSALAGELEPPADIPPVPPEIPLALPSELLSKQPDLRRAERELAAATARIGVARADLLPRFAILGSFGRRSEDASDLTKGSAQFWNMIPAVRWPCSPAEESGPT